MIIVYSMAIITIVALASCIYLLSRAQKHLDDATKICEDAVRSLRSGGP